MTPTADRWQDFETFYQANYAHLTLAEFIAKLKEEDANDARDLDGEQGERRRG